MSAPSPTYARLLKLLSLSLYSGPEEKLTLGETLREQQWLDIMAEARKQTLTGIVFNAVSRLADDEMPPVSVLAPWLAKTHRIHRANEAMTGVIARLVPQLEAAGLHPVLQKGHSAARFYSNPRLRTCGDIDLWFPPRERAEADRFARACGHKVVSTPDRGSSYVVDSTEVEHHSMLIEIHNPRRAKTLRRLLDENPPVRAALDGGSLSVCIPAPMVELLMINAHILKHCLGVGIGLRQFCDYAVAWRGLAGNGVDVEEYFNLCRQLGIIRWTRVLHQFINRYMPAPDGSAVTPVDDRDCTRSVERVFSMVSEGGNFGRYNPRRKFSSNLTLWQRKLSTMSSFIVNRAFVRRLAPAEAFWTFTRLLAGQIH